MIGGWSADNKFDTLIKATLRCRRRRRAYVRGCVVNVQLWWWFFVDGLMYLDDCKVLLWKIYLFYQIESTI